MLYCSLLPTTWLVRLQFQKWNLWYKLISCWWIFNRRQVVTGKCLEGMWSFKTMVCFMILTPSGPCIMSLNAKMKRYNISCLRSTYYPHNFLLCITFNAKSTSIPSSVPHTTWYSSAWKYHVICIHRSPANQ